MKLKIRYDNEVQTLELNAADMEQLWVSLSLEGEGLSQEERERRIQGSFDERFNRPEYNVWHRETRHIDPTPKCKRMDGRKGYIQGDPADPSFNIMDYLITKSDTEDRDNRIEYEEVCRKVRSILTHKPEWADMFISIRLNGEAVRAYAARKGLNENNITQKLKRAEQKLREKWR